MAIVFGSLGDLTNVFCRGGGVGFGGFGGVGAAMVAAPKEVFPTGPISSLEDFLRDAQHEVEHQKAVAFVAGGAAANAKVLSAPAAVAGDPFLLEVQSPPPQQKKQEAQEEQDECVRQAPEALGAEQVEEEAPEPMDGMDDIGHPGVECVWEPHNVDRVEGQKCGACGTVKRHGRLMIRCSTCRAIVCGVFCAGGPSGRRRCPAGCCAAEPAEPTGSMEEEEEEAEEPVRHVESADSAAEAGSPLADLQESLGQTASSPLLAGGPPCSLLGPAFPLCLGAAAACAPLRLPRPGQQQPEEPACEAQDKAAALTGAAARDEEEAATEDEEEDEEQPIVEAEGEEQAVAQAELPVASGGADALDDELERELVFVDCDPAGGDNDDDFEWCECAQDAPRMPQLKQPAPVEVCMVSSMKLDEHGTLGAWHLVGA